MDNVYGTLKLLILRVLQEGSAHGLGIKHTIEASTGGDLVVEAGALYPALHRLHRDGLVAAEWGRSDLGRRAKIYEITAAGRAALERERDRWRRHTGAVDAILDGRLGNGR